MNEKLEEIEIGFLSIRAAFRDWLRLLNATTERQIRHDKRTLDGWINGQF